MKLLNRCRARLMAGLIFAAATLTPPVAAQGPRRIPPPPDVTILAGQGSTIGVSIRDLDAGETERQKLTGGVVIEDVRVQSPAEKAGLKKGDVVVEFDGERVRSARQLSRIVQETPPGRSARIAVMRDGRKVDASVVPDRARAADVLIDRDRLAERLEDLKDRLPFPPDFGRPLARGRLGATVQDLTPQLAEYLGVNQGVLITAVSDNTPASRAGLKAGDVVRSVDGRNVASRAELTRLLRDVESGREVTIGIVREKKEMSVKATLEPADRRQGRPARFTRGV